MTDDTSNAPGNAQSKKTLEDQIKDLNREIRLLKRMNERPKMAPFMPFGMQSFSMPPPPPPPPAMMTATGPMMLAWLLSWLYSSGAANPMMLEQMARFSADREAFWHQASEAITSVADQANGHAAAVTAEDKKKIRAALEAQKLEPGVIDVVLHAMNALDAAQSQREATTRNGR